MGVIMGEYIDEYTIDVSDVFAMPQLQTTVSVEAVDPAYQAKMFEMLKVVGKELVMVGWYHSHPGYGCWLSAVDVQTQKSFEQQGERSVAVVVDPVQSTGGVVVMDAFRTIPMNLVAMNDEPRITTANKYYTKVRAERMAKLRGLGRLYYNLNIDSQCEDELEVNMLGKLSARDWKHTLLQFHEGELAQKAAEKSDKPREELKGGFCTEHDITVGTLKKLSKMAKLYKQQIVSQAAISDEQFDVKNRYVGKVVAKRELASITEELMADQINSKLTMMLNTVIF
eukprot:Macronucleus_729.p1 GENE.Macronucleus_729~~Macronucleus_729.p1  ORF type:complete len:325 (+),score=65.28 Macronucleus_729:127-975(+)